MFLPFAENRPQDFQSVSCAQVADSARLGLAVHICYGTYGYYGYLLIFLKERAPAEGR
jgi:hypothetical protein